MSELLTASQAAARLRVTPSTVARWVKTNVLTPHFKAPGLRGQYVFTASEVERVARERAAELDAKRPAVSA